MKSVSVLRLLILYDVLRLRTESICRCLGLHFQSTQDVLQSIWNESSQTSTNNAALSITKRVTGQLADTPTRGMPTRGLDDSRTGQLADATGDFACLVFVLFGGICESAS